MVMVSQILRMLVLTLLAQPSSTDVLTAMVTVCQIILTSVLTNQVLQPTTVVLGQIVMVTVYQTKMICVLTL
jgi:hypothetical protein